MPTTIFFSWQIDRPPREGRNFIEKALERAAGQISVDATVEDAIRDQIEIDRDTKGVPGSPPIVETIFRKIDNAAVFVPDLTFVGARPDGRPTPNPNVLIEYGWALKSLTHARIVPVMNTAFGEPNEVSMPFDMRHLRHPVCYHCPENADEETRRRIRAELAREFESRLRTIFNSRDFGIIQPVPPPVPFVPREPRNGLGKFRLPGEPLGVSEAGLTRGGKPVKLSVGPAVWLRVMPKTDPGKEWLVTDLKKAATDGGKFLRPIGEGWMSFDFLRNHDGFGIYAGQREPDDETSSVVFAFTNREVWAIDTYILPALNHSDHKVIPPYDKELRSSLTNYGDFLVRLGVNPPFNWIAGMEDLRGRGVVDPTGRMAAFRGPIGSCLEEVVMSEGEFSPGDPPGKSLSSLTVAGSSGLRSSTNKECLLF